MSRIAKFPLTVPSGVSLEVGQAAVLVSGPKGNVSVIKPRGIDVAIAENIIRLSKGHGLTNLAMLGTSWALLRNALIGVSDGWRKGVELVGVGYQAKVDGNVVRMSVGRSHVVVVNIPAGLTVSVEGSQVFVHGACRDAVGVLCSKLRAARTPEPYRLTGVKYIGEVIRKKAGKSGKK